MTTNFLVEFPQIHGVATEVYNQIGQCLPRRARVDDKRKSRTVLQMDRATFDSVRGKNGTLGIYRQFSPWPVANVDFEAHDGTLHLTAEACLAHELQARFGVDITSLDALAAKIAHFVSLEDWQNLEYSGPVKTDNATPESPISAIEFAIKAKGQTVEQIAEATSLHVQDVNNIVTQNPHLFKRGAGGRIFLLPQAE